MGGVKREEEEGDGEMGVVTGCGERTNLGNNFPSSPRVDVGHDRSLGARRLPDHRHRLAQGEGCLGGRNRATHEFPSLKAWEKLAAARINTEATHLVAAVDIYRMPNLYSVVVVENQEAASQNTAITPASRSSNPAATPAETFSNADQTTSHFRFRRWSCQRIRPFSEPLPSQAGKRVHQSVFSTSCEYVFMGFAESLTSFRFIAVL